MDPVYSQHACGMTKREEFAKAAMQGLLSNDQIVHLVPAEDLHVVTKHAVQLADWLVEALNTEKP